MHLLLIIGILCHLKLISSGTSIRATGKATRLPAHHHKDLLKSPQEVKPIKAREKFEPNTNTCTLLILLCLLINQRLPQPQVDNLTSTTAPVV